MPALLGLTSRAGQCLQGTLCHAAPPGTTIRTATPVAYLRCRLPGCRCQPRKLQRRCQRCRRHRSQLGLGLQDWPDAQVMKQPPQLLGSVVVSTQLFPQIVLAARNRATRQEQYKLAR